MSSGSGSAIAVFAGVLVVTGGLAFLLYQTGEEAAPAEEDPSALEPARRVPRSRPKPPPVEPPFLPPHVQPPKVIPPEGASRFKIAGHEDVALRDLTEVAAAYRAMCVVFREMADLGDPDPDDTERMERSLQLAERLQRVGFFPPPGWTTERKPTPMEHPAYASNLIAVLLAADGLPLSAAQSERLEELARSRSPLIDAADAAIEADDGVTLLISRIAARARAIDEFYAEVYALLSPAQAEALVPAPYRHRTRLDLLSSGVTWGRIVRPLPVQSKSELVEFMTHAIGSQLELGDRTDALHAIVERWANEDSIPAADAYERRNCVRTSVASAAVARMESLLGRLPRELELGPEAAERLRLTSSAVVPLMR
jgi:hypothetical protein